MSQLDDILMKSKPTPVKPEKYMVTYDFSYGFTVMFFLILMQLCYAIYKRSPEAIRLDVALLLGSIMMLADYFGSWILMDLQFLFMVIGDFYIVYKMRELQDTGTNPIIFYVFLALALILSIIFGFSDQDDLTVNTAYYSCISILQFITFAVSLTLRSNAYENYRTLPVFLINIGALLYLLYFIG